MTKMNAETLAKLLLMARDADQKWLGADLNDRRQEGIECDFAWRAYADAYQLMHPYDSHERYRQ
jgi:hypothetical protein